MKLILKKPRGVPSLSATLANLLRLAPPTGTACLKAFGDIPSAMRVKKKKGQARPPCLAGSHGGQAMIVAILIIFMAAMAIGVAAATIAITQTNVVQNMNLSKQAYNLAESGVDNTTMRMTKGDFSNPGVLSEGAGTCTITVSGSLPYYQILSVAEITSPLGGGKKATKKIKADVTISTDGVVSITSFQEVYE